MLKAALSIGIYFCAGLRESVVDIRPSVAGREGPGAWMGMPLKLYAEAMSDEMLSIHARRAVGMLSLNMPMMKVTQEMKGRMRMNCWTLVNMGDKASGLTMVVPGSSHSSDHSLW